MTTPVSAPPLTALLAGASGLVGKELLALLCASPHYSAVHSLVRRASGRALPKLTEHVIDFEALPELPACDDVWRHDWNRTIVRDGAMLIARYQSDDDVVCSAKARGAFGDRIEHRLRISR